MVDCFPRICITRIISGPPADAVTANLVKGRIIFEIDGVSEEIAREALYKASAKLPIKTKFVKR